MNRYYAGIGARQTPKPYLDLMRDIAAKLALQKMTLRSGGADGADSAFEYGHRVAMTAQRAEFVQEPEIFLPWKGFNRNESSLVARDLPGKAAVIAAAAHPNWRALRPAAKWMHTRNVAQVLGADLETPSEFVICWTPKGSGSGGTGQAIRVAQEYDIPVYDLGALALPWVRRALGSRHGLSI